MIREQSRFTINPLYVVAVALCCVCAVTTTLLQGVFIGLVTVVVSLISINIVSMVEKIADKNLRAFLIAIIAGLLIVVGQYVIEIVNKKFFTSNLDNLKWVVMAVVTLSIVPTYFERSALRRTDFFQGAKSPCPQIFWTENDSSIPLQA